MKKHANLIRSLAALVLSSAIITGCSGLGTKPTEANAPNFDVQKLEPAKISFCFIGYGGNNPYNIDQVNEMLVELNKKTIKEINTEISFKWLVYQNYDAELALLLKSGSGPDAFFTWSGGDTLVKEGAVKDITDLFTQLAPNYYSEVTESRKEDFEYNKIDGKVYYIPNNWLTLPRDYIIAREDLVKKYAPDGISTFDDYWKFMEQVKLYEKDVTPALLDPYSFFMAYMKGNGYFQDIPTMCFKLDAEDMTPIPVEDTQEFKEAYKFYKEGVEKGFIINYSDPSCNAILSAGRLGSMLQIGEQLHSMYNGLPRGFNYCTYTLNPDKLYQTYFPSQSLAINSDSPNPERVLIFIEWLQSSQENYDLLMYGIEGKQYSLQGNKADIINGNDMIFNWDGNDVFRNYLYERPYFFEPENYKEFLEKNCTENTENYFKTFERYGYDIKKYLNAKKEDRAILDEAKKTVSTYSDTRAQIYYKFMEKLRAGDFSKTLSEYMNEEGGKEAKEKLIKAYPLFMNKIKK